jgi:hypothetical protein
MISPEMPTCRAIRQTVFHNKANGKGDHGVGITGFGRGEIGRIVAKMELAFTTVVKGVTQNDVDGTTGERIAEVMQ